MPTIFFARHEPTPAGTMIWIAILATFSVLFSFAFACATPFAALATVAGTRMARRDAFAAVTLAWLGNQAIGFLVLHYPRTPDSFGWGLAIGLAALLATVGAMVSVRFVTHAILATLVAFVAAMMLYEGGLFAATAILPSGAGAGAFSAHVVARIVEINAIALVALLVIHKLASTIGLTPSRRLLVTSA